jgi:ParB-like chromosome segregation protein Spo0J
MAKKKPRANTDNVPVWCSHDAIVACVDLKPNPKNPNTHPAKQIELLSKIIIKQGWRMPITVSNRSGLIVKGHGRLIAAFKAGISHAPIDYQDYETDDMEYADMIADNKLAELAELDNKVAEIAIPINLVSGLIGALQTQYDLYKDNIDGGVNAKKTSKS